MPRRPRSMRRREAIALTAMGIGAWGGVAKAADTVTLNVGRYGQCPVRPSNQAMVSLGELGVRTYIAEPDRGPRDWDGKRAEKEAVWQPAAHPGRAWQADAAANVGRRSNGTSRTNSIRVAWHGPAIRSGHRECAQETADPGGGVQFGAADALDAWSGQAASRSRSGSRSYLRGSGAHKSDSKPPGAMGRDVGQFATPVASVFAHR
jgi:hypothetical protein